MAALLETYVKRVGGSPHLPAMVPALLSALDKAAKPSGSPALADRLQVPPTCQPMHLIAHIPSSPYVSTHASLFLHISLVS